MKKHFALLALIPLFLIWYYFGQEILSGTLQKHTKNGYINITFSGSPFAYIFCHLFTIVFMVLFSLPSFFALWHAYFTKKKR